MEERSGPSKQIWMPTRTKGIHALAVAAWWKKEGWGVGGMGGDGGWSDIVGAI